MSNRSQVFFFCLLSLSAFGQRLEDQYPHWPTDDASRRQLEAIEDFIIRNSGAGKAAVFDWDGTLYSEKLRIKNAPIGLRHPERPRAAQPAWHIWAASQLQQQDRRDLFPAFRTAESQEERARNLLQRDDYLEAMFDNRPDDVSKFLQISTLEAGMQPATLARYLGAYAKAYDPCVFAIYPMMDVMQRFADNGFSVWIVTGSNPYFVAAMLAHVERNCRFDGKRPYRFKVAKGAAYDPAFDHIIGNGAELLADGTFSQSFDGRFFRRTEQEADAQLYVVADEGKRVAVQRWIEQGHREQVVFVAGNSDGDDAMARYVLDKGATGTAVFAIGVNPRNDKFPATLERFADLPHVRALTIQYEERSE